MKIILKVNHILFWWYYRKASDHFKGYTFFKSVSLLRQHYEWIKDVNDATNKNLKDCILESDRIRTELSNIKIGQVASENQITNLNKTFGTKINKPTDN